MRSAWTRNRSGLAAIAIALLAAAPAQAGFGELRPVSLTPDGSAFSDAHSGDPIVSADGRYVVFESASTNLVPGQTGSTIALFMRDVVTGQTTLVSHKAGAPAETRQGNTADVSADGRYVAYTSTATDIISGFSGGVGAIKVFLFDRNTGSNVLVSHTSVSPTTNANGQSFAPAISADGRFVAFESFGNDVVAGQVDGPADKDVFLYDVATGTNRIVSHTPASTTTTGTGESRDPDISDDGGRVSFESVADDLTAGANTSTLSVFAFERAGGTNKLVSRDASNPANSADGASFSARISGDGQWVLFGSSGQTLVPGFDDNNGTGGDLYVAAVESTATLLASHGPAGPASGASDNAIPIAISHDGGTAVFLTSAADLVPGQSDLNATRDSFAFDRGTGAVALLSSVASDPKRTGDKDSNATAMSRDGRYVVLVSSATDLIAGQQDGNVDNDVFVRDTVRGVTRLVSPASGSGATTGNGSSELAELSDDGRTLAFTSRATDLVSGPGDANGEGDIFAARNRAPVASATVAPESGAAPLAVTLDGSASSDPDGAIASHSWDHGDGTSSSGATAAHTYPAPGTYTVTLTVRDDDGAVATAARVVSVGAAPGAPGPGGVLPTDRRAPLMVRLGVSPSAFQPLPRGPSIPTGRRRGTTLRYTLDEPATVRFTVERRTTGRRVGRRCVRQTARNRKRRRCTRFAAVRGSFTHVGTVGANRLRFSGRLRNRPLSRGSYRLVARATDAAGNRSTVKRASFRIVGPARR
jgi:PKD repeat protein